ncbi:MAG: DUF6242 domain-containing protein [Dysgonomonas sp.]
MKFKHTIFLFLSFLFIYSCDDDNSNTYILDASNDAQIYSFTIKASHPKTGDSISRAQDSIRFLSFNRKNYAIDQLKSEIYNPDSLPYGLALKKVKMTLTFNKTYGASKVEIQHPDSAGYREWDTKDSVDFSKNSLKIRVTAPNGNNKEYNVRLLIHQIDPDLMTWQSIGNLPLDNITNIKTLIVNNTFYVFANTVDMHTTVLFKSDMSGKNWEQKSVNGLSGGMPLTENPRNIYFHKGKFYINWLNRLHTSNDGENWTDQPNNENYEISGIYGVIPNSSEEKDVLLVGIQEGSNYYYGITSDGSSIAKIDRIPDSPNNNTIGSDFPLTGYSSISVRSADRNKNYLVIVGGVNNSNPLGSTWLITSDGNGIERTSTKSNPYFKGIGLSAFMYNNQIYVLNENQFYISSSWGQSWIKASDKQKPDTGIAIRNYQSVAVDDKNNIWLFGGNRIGGNTSPYLNDIWKGRLNSLIVN